MTKPKLKVRKPPKPGPSQQFKFGMTPGRKHTKPRDLPEIADREQQIAEFLKRKKKAK